MNTKNRWLFFPLLILFILSLKFNIFILPLLACNIVIALCTSQFDFKFSALFLPIIFLTAFLISGYTLGFTICLSVLPGYSIGKCIKEKSSFSLMLIIATISALVALVVQTLIISNQLQVEPSVWLFKDTINVTKNFIVENGTFDGEKTEFIFSQFNEITKMLESMLPFFYITVALVLAYITFAVVRFILEKQKQKIDFMPYFYQFWLPSSVNIIFVLLFIVSLFTESMVLMNVISVTFLIHVVCGIATADAYMRKFGLSKGIRVLVLTILFALASLMGGFLTTILCYLGMSGRKNVE